MKTTKYAKKDEVNRKWYVVDAADKVLGRLASKIAARLIGKDKAIFTPNADTGDFVIVVNAEKIRLTGKKLDNKVYVRHSGYPGGYKEETARERMQSHPERIIEAAVKGMLPKTKLGRAMGRKLKVYAGPKHEHSAQKPEPLAL